ncbi:RNA polymerase sigma factor [Mucilaginibacter calamicampi]|uniref:RNA polymerase sigma factor n=1 Tax=Mucilaginibacter calamicampi TaxID=1302352 RepID=A0ABW2YXW8_9SPHI
MSDEELHHLIQGCVKKDSKSQKLLYKAFYGFSMAICLRYATNQYEAAEVMNQGFFKIFTKIEAYNASRPFKAWLGRIMMNTAIDYYRSNLKMAYAQDLDTAEHIGEVSMADNNLNYNDLLAMIQQLPQSYRTVFNLFAIDGYSHEEIAEMLDISSGTSKSNLFKARQKLKQMIMDAEASAYDYNNGTKFSPVVAINGAAAIKPVYYNIDTRE